MASAFDEVGPAAIAAMVRDLDEAREAGAWTSAVVLDAEGRALARSGRSWLSADRLAALAAAGRSAGRGGARLVGDDALALLRLRVGPGCMVLACFAEGALLAVEHDLARTTPEEVDRVIGVLAPRLRPALEPPALDADLRALDDALAWLCETAPDP